MPKLVQTALIAVRLFPTGPAVYLADPADIKTVFAGSPPVMHAGDARR